MHTRYPVTERANRGRGRYKFRIVNVRNQFNRCHAQFQVRLAAICHCYCLRETSSLKWCNVVIDRLEPAEPLAIPKYRTIRFKTVLCRIADLRVFFKQHALELIAAESSLDSSSVKTHQRSGVRKRINYLAPNLELCTVGPLLVSETIQALLRGIVCLVKVVALV